MKPYRHTLQMRYIFCVSLLTHGCLGNKNNKKSKKKFLVLVKIIVFSRGVTEFCLF